MPINELNIEEILRILKKHHVDFIVVGGVCGVLHGSDILTFDLDIVQSRALENLQRLEDALTELKAYYREHPPFKIVPEAKRLSTSGHHLLMTDAGTLDVLGTLTGNRGYEELLPHTVEQQTTEGEPFLMLDLPTLIAVKAETGRIKDKLAVINLRHLLKMKE